MSISQNQNIAYSLNQPLSNVFPSPIVSRRSPATSDKAQIGTVWVNKLIDDAWVLTSIVNNSATWISIGGGSGTFSSLTVTGNVDLTTNGAGWYLATDTGTGTMEILVPNLITIYSQLGAVSLSGNTDVDIAAATGNIIMNSFGALQVTADGGVSITTSNDAVTVVTGTGAVSISADATANTLNFGTGAGAKLVTVGSVTGASSLALKTGSGNFTLDGVAGSTYTVGASTTTGTIAIGGTAQTGAITIGGGTGAQIVNLATGGTGAKTVNIASGASANVTTIGTTTAASTLTLNTPTGTPVAAANGLTATVGNITTTNGNVVLSTAATYVQLPGPIKIMSGAGAPANGLAAEAGDMYIRTDPAGATSRIYIATAANAWTNVTCAA